MSTSEASGTCAICGSTVYLWLAHSCPTAPLPTAKPHEAPTPRTDAAIYADMDAAPVREWVKADFARQLERELTEARAQAARMLDIEQERILLASEDEIRKEILAEGRDPDEYLRAIDAVAKWAEKNAMLRHDLADTADRLEVCGTMLNGMAELRDELKAEIASLRSATVRRVLFEDDAHCPHCGHNRDASSVSSILLSDGTRECQMCGALWREIARPDNGTKP